MYYLFIFMMLTLYDNITYGIHRKGILINVMDISVHTFPVITI